MKMVKSLLLGSAAGLVAMAGAQAADLPVKAKPVQYVKICSLYGAGFYYIPGTDTCIKIGGFFRTEWNFNANGSFAPYTADNYTRTSTYIRNRSRVIVTFDVRSQTEYGTLRGYSRAGWQWTSQDKNVGGSQGSFTAGPGAINGVTGVPAGAIAAGFPGTANPANLTGTSSPTYMDRAFIQLAGFTFGKTQSYYDFFNIGAFSNQTNWLWMDTGGSGTPVFAYTAQFGNGVSATLSAEDYTEQQLPVVPLGPAGYLSIGAGSSVGVNRGYWMPDFVANLRIDQAWGAAQIAGALHQVAATYYPGSTATVFATPGDKWGFAIGGGLTFNLPMIAAGDIFSIAANYCEGASRYCSNPAGGIAGSSAFYFMRDGGSVGFGQLVDAYFAANGAGGGTQLELPHAWNVMAGFAHKWNPKWQTSLYGGYLNYNANSPTLRAACVAIGNAKCFNWSAWEVGTRTLWNPVANLDVSVDVLYHKINGALTGLGAAAPIGSGQAALVYGNADTFSGILRFQRNFWP